MVLVQQYGTWYFYFFICNTLLQWESWDWSSRFDVCKMNANWNRETIIFPLCVALANLMYANWNSGHFLYDTIRNGSVYEKSTW